MGVQENYGKTFMPFCRSINIKKIAVQFGKQNQSPSAKFLLGSFCIERSWHPIIWRKGVGLIISCVNCVTPPRKHRHTYARTAHLLARCGANWPTSLPRTTFNQVLRQLRSSDGGDAAGAKWTSKTNLFSIESWPIFGGISGRRGIEEPSISNRSRQMQLLCKTVQHG